MELQDFYKQAREWKRTKEEQDREDEIKRLAQLKEAWKPSSEAIRKVLPISGARIFESYAHTYDEMPVNGRRYSFDIVLPGVAFNNRAEDRCMKGVIRVTLLYTLEDGFSHFEYNVWTAKGVLRFTNPYEAFLACCEELGYQPEPS